MMSCLRRLQSVLGMPEDKRAPETKKALIKELLNKIETMAGISPVDVEVTIKEQLAYCRVFHCINASDCCAKLCAFAVSGLGARVPDHSLVLA